MTRPPVFDSTEDAAAYLLEHGIIGHYLTLRSTLDWWSSLTYGPMEALAYPRCSWRSTGARSSDLIKSLAAATSRRGVSGTCPVGR
jgi:hypothetical protein